jgi:hypothetical protein
LANSFSFFNSDPIFALEQINKQEGKLKPSWFTEEHQTQKTGGDLWLS